MGSAFCRPVEEFSSLTAEDVGNLVATLGAAYTGLKNLFVDNGIDGAVATSCANEADAEKYLKDVGVTNSAHIRRIILEMSKLGILIASTPYGGLSSLTGTTGSVSSPAPRVITPSTILSINPTPIQPPTPPLQNSALFHAFLAHNWGKDNQNHLRVAAIHRALKLRKCSTSSHTA